jgi:hypothetical protein
MKYDDLFSGTIVYGSFEPNASLMVTAGVDANPQWAEKLVQAKAALEERPARLRQRWTNLLSESGLPWP